MSGRICRTAEQAFEAGWTEQCEHNLAPDKCPTCGLTDAEIARLVVLLSGLADRTPEHTAAA
ncbi:hypothetical protein [Streptomyces sp. NPDC004528]|uniref:hypothetical protein n=1 Tax=Streptomyces sp. NPDC004528 TaxID=3154550 RepID=UPI00339EDE48